MDVKLKVGVNALSGWYLISTDLQLMEAVEIGYSVNALSGWYLISTPDTRTLDEQLQDVSMPSRADTSFLLHSKLQ